MEIITRALAQNDKDAALWVEKGAMPHHTYLADVWELFTSGNGDLIGAFVEGKLVGIGKITRLYGAYGWLETLRVHPDWQRKGVGSAIWQQYALEWDAMQLCAVGMYTEDYNIASKTLAEKHGLSHRGDYTEYLCDARPSGSASAFTAVLPQDGEAMLAPHYNHMPPYLVVNRTFYPVCKGLGAHAAQSGWLYADDDGNVVVAGNRFHQQRQLHVPFIAGNTEKALQFCFALAAQRQAPQLSTFAPTGDNAAKCMESRGFTQADSFMTLWIDR